MVQALLAHPRLPGVALASGPPPLHFQAVVRWSWAVCPSHYRFPADARAWDR